jgi:hypothetical protein
MAVGTLNINQYVGFSSFKMSLLWDATSQRGLKIKKSARGAAGSREGAVRTQNIDGSI